MPLLTGWMSDLTTGEKPKDPWNKTAIKSIIKLNKENKFY